jgi:hypothetical protein
MSGGSVQAGMWALFERIAPSRRSRRLTTLLVLLPIGLGVGFAVLKFVYGDFYYALLEEDSLMETIQWVTYLSASILLMMPVLMPTRKVTFLHRCLLLVIVLVLFFVAAEEVSWGQRLAHIQTPPLLLRLNAQQEITVHNLRALQRNFTVAFVVVGLLLALTWIPVSWWMKRNRLSRLGRMLSELAPPWYLAHYFVPLIVVYWCLAKAGADGGGCYLCQYVSARDQEVGEFFLSVGILLSVLRTVVLLSKRGDIQR